MTKYFSTSQERSEETALVRTLIGKTIASIRLDHGWEGHDLVITFTDGTALSLDGAGYDADSITGEISSGIDP